MEIRQQEGKIILTKSKQLKIMEELELYDGLNVLAETHDTLIDDVSHFTLLWANHLAKTHKVLYISWDKKNDFSIRKLKEMGRIEAKNLSISIEFDSFYTVAFFEIVEKVKKEKFEIIVFNGKPTFYDSNWTNRLGIIPLIEFLIQKLHIKAILTLPISFVFRMEPRIVSTNIRDYEIPRKITNTASQILFLHRPFAHTFNPESQRNIDPGELEIISLKNKGLEEFIIKLMNTDLNPFL